MVKRKLFIIIFLSMLFSFSFAYAYDLEMTIETSQPEVGLVARVMDASGNIVDSIYSETGKDGMAIINYSTGREEISLSVMLVYDDSILEQKEFDDIKSNSGKVFLSFFDRKEPLKSETPVLVEATNVSINVSNSVAVEENVSKREVVQEENVSNQLSEEDSYKITGKAITDIFSSRENSIFYIGLGILAILVLTVIIYIFIGIFRRKKMPEGPKDHHIKEFSKSEPDEGWKKAVINSVPMKEEISDEDDDPQIQEAKRKIADLERQIEGLKKSEELILAQKKFERAQRELERLRNDRSENSQGN